MAHAVAMSAVLRLWVFRTCGGEEGSSAATKLPHRQRVKFTVARRWHCDNLNEMFAQDTGPRAYGIVKISSQSVNCRRGDGPPACPFAEDRHYVTIPYARGGRSR